MKSSSLAPSSAFALSLASFCLLTVFAHSALAAGGGKYLEPTKPTKPATRYSGRTPIDLSTGLVLANGVQGLQNEAYEAWASGPYTVPGMSEKTYPFSSKDAFIRTMKESEKFIETAIANWKMRTPETKIEAAKYSDEAIATITPHLEKFKNALEKASDASQSEWESAQAEARRTLIELRAFYSQLHNNVN